MREISAISVLTHRASKKLIAKGVVNLQEVRSAKRVFVCNGTTTAYVLMELTGKVLEPTRYTIGIITPEGLSVTPADTRIPAFIVENGDVVEGVDFYDELKKVGENDVIVKGVNAVDPEGNVAVFVYGREAGTVGTFTFPAVNLGVPIIAPVSLEKLVPSVPDAVRSVGGLKVLRFFSGNIKSVPFMLPSAVVKVVTEKTALEVLFPDVEVEHIASGGNLGAEGCVVLSLRGEEKAVEKAFSFLEELRGRGI